MAFFEENAERLKDEVNGAEESKINTPNFHQKYISILKANIHSKLSKKFSSNQIDAFYIDYEQNQNKYEQADSLTKNLLITFIDYQMFQKEAIRHQQA